MAATLLPVVDPNTKSDAGGLPTRRELTVVAIVLAMVVAAVLLLVAASSQVAAALATP